MIDPEKLPERVRDAIKSFVASIAPVRSAYGEAASFSYLVAKTPTGNRLVRGTVTLNVRPSRIPFLEFSSPSIVAAHIRLSDWGYTAETFIEALLTGSIRSPSGMIDFSAAGSGGHAALFEPFRKFDDLNQTKLSALTLFGGPTEGLIRQPEIDWEVRAAGTPYFNLTELLNTIFPGEIASTARIDVLAWNLAAIENGSRVDGEVATLRILKADSADAGLVSAGYRISSGANVLHRGQVEASSFKWVDSETGPVGEAKFTVPRGTTVHAIAKYNGIAQHHYFFSDPQLFQNRRRLVYETSLDPALRLMIETLNRSKGARAPSRDFEVYISWLFWMLGFATAHVGQVQTEAPDTIMASPNGHFAVVECTTNFLDSAKLGKLHARVQGIRRSLEVSNAREVRVLPIIVTALATDEIQSEMIEQARKLGMYVLAREGIDALVGRTLAIPDADTFFAEAERSVVGVQPGQGNLF